MDNTPPHPLTAVQVHHRQKISLKHFLKYFLFQEAESPLRAASVARLVVRLSTSTPTTTSTTTATTSPTDKEEVRTTPTLLQLDLRVTSDQSDIK